MCMYVLCVCTYVHVAGAHVGARGSCRPTQDILTQVPFTLRKSLSLTQNTLSRLGWLACEAQGSTSLHLPKDGLISTFYNTQGFWGLNLCLSYQLSYPPHA